MESKINLWDLGIENLSDGFRTLLKDLKKLLKLEKRWDSKFNLRNVNFFLGDITGKRRSTILASFQKICPLGSKHQLKMHSVFWVHCVFWVLLSGNHVSVSFPRKADCASWKRPERWKRRPRSAAAGWRVRRRRD